MAASACFFNDTQPAGKPLPLYYRFLITDRSVQDTAGIGIAYNAFQYPPVVTASKGTTGAVREAIPKSAQYSRSGFDPRLGIRIVGKELRLAQSQPVKVSLYTINGKLLLSRELSAQSSSMSFGSLAKGLVWVRVQGAFETMTQAFLVP